MDETGVNFTPDFHFNRNYVYRILNNTVFFNVTKTMHRKPHLPSKTCMVCNRPFSWRKKWEKVWDEVKYCSDKCRKNRSHAEKK